MSKKITEHPLKKDFASPIWYPADRLAVLKMFYEKGVSEALHSALVICGDAGGAPDWVIGAAREQIEKFIKGEKFTRTNADGSPGPKPKTLIKNFRRWWAVIHLTEKYEYTYEEAYERAAQFLGKEFDDNVGTESIKKSYSKVATDLKDPDRAKQYFWGMRETRELTGIGSPTAWVAG